MTLHLIDIVTRVLVPYLGKTMARHAAFATVDRLYRSTQRMDYSHGPKPTIFPASASPPPMRVFDTGASRDSEHQKLDFEGFFSPQAMEVFAKYMNFHREMPDGSRRDSDNWQKGFPISVIMKSMWRHFFHLWKWHRCEVHVSLTEGHPLADACGVWFNVQAYIKQVAEADPTSVNAMLDFLTLDRKRRQEKQP